MNKNVSLIVIGTILVSNDFHNFLIRILLGFIGIALMITGIENMYDDLGGK